MTSYESSHLCQRARELLTEQGPEGLRQDPEARAHVESCDSCFEILEQQAALDEALAALPTYDVGDEVVARLLERPELHSPVAATPPETRPAAWRRAYRALTERSNRGRLALAASLLLALTLYLQMPGLDRAPSYVTQEARIEPSQDLEAIGHLGDDGEMQSESAGARREGEEQIEQIRVYSEAPILDEMNEETRARIRQQRDLTSKNQFSGSIANPPPGADPAILGGDIPALPVEQKQQTFFDSVEIVEVDTTLFVSEAKMSASYPDSPSEDSILEEETRALSDVKDEEASLWVGTDADITFRGGSPREEPEGAGPFADERSNEARQKLRERLEALPRRPEPEAEENDAAPLRKRDDFAAPKPEVSKEKRRAEPPVDRDPPARQVARRFLAERSRIDGVATRPAEGYWANTYVPGDPALRQLQARLLGQRHAEIDRPHERSRRPAQPFDLPPDAAVGVFLHADRTGLEGPTRMLVQVGLQASERHGGRRPAMNLALVLDLPPTLEIEEASALRALLLAFEDDKDLGDSFQLVVAGRPGGRILTGETFRHGPLTVHLDRLLGGGEPLEGPELGLGEALELAFESVRAGEDPTAPLGSSAVIVVTAGDLTQLSSLASTLHRQAVAGIPTSVIALGDDPAPSRLQQLALAGQGNLRLLHSAAEAEAVVDRELAAVTQAVARALRLRIRLAPGVELVDIPGSRRLDEEQARHTRESEQAIDQRLSRNLGITSDRGEDEEGLQIVIPSLLAGDSHVVLLDVIAPGPGPIAEVQLRYKDLVHLDNGVARAQLSLGRDVREPGALERNVLENLLAQHMREALDAAGAKARAGDPEAAALLRDLRLLLEGLALEVPGFATDPDLLRDLEMVREFEALLATEPPDQTDLHDYIGDSLQLAALLKALPRPEAPDPRTK